MKTSFTILCALIITAGCNLRYPIESRFPDKNTPTDSSSNSSADIMSYMGMIIIFEDPELPVLIQKRIATDYKAVLHWNEPKGMVRAGTRTMRINDENLTITHMLDFSAEDIELPYEYSYEFGVVGQRDDGQTFLVISKLLSEGYRNAIELMETHRHALLSVTEFVELLNSMDKHKLPSVDQLMYFYGRGAEENNAEMIRSANANDAAREQYIGKFIDSFGGYRYALGGILEHQTIDERPAVRLYVQNKSTEKWSLDIMHVIFDEGTWKLLVLLF